MAKDYRYKPYADLSGLEFQMFEDLSGVDLKGANLKHANFREANLTHANLSEANTINTKFFGAIMPSGTIHD